MVIAQTCARPGYEHGQGYFVHQSDDQGQLEDVGSYYQQPQKRTGHEAIYQHEGHDDELVDYFVSIF